MHLAMDLLDRLTVVLARTHGDIPRRAVLGAHDDVLCDLRDAPPGSRECHLLSTICEVVKKARGDRIYSRDASVLLAECIHTDDEAPWMALCDDAMRGELTPDAIRTHFEAHPHDTLAFIHRFRGATLPEHATRVLKVFSMCVPLFPEAARGRFVAELYHTDGVAFLVAFSHAAKSLPPKVRMLALASMGRQIADDEIYRALARGAFRSPAIHDDVLTILMASPCAPSLATAVDDPLAALCRMTALATQSPVPRRAPYLSALAHLVRGGVCIPPVTVQAIHALVHHTVRASPEPAVMCAAAGVLHAMEPESVYGALAAAFEESVRARAAPNKM